MLISRSNACLGFTVCLRTFFRITGSIKFVMNTSRLRVSFLFSKITLFSQFFEFPVEVFKNFASKLVCDQKDVTIEIIISWSYKSIFYYFPKFSCGHRISHYMWVFCNSGSCIVGKLFVSPRVARVCPHT